MVGESDKQEEGLRRCTWDKNHTCESSHLALQYVSHDHQVLFKCLLLNVAFVASSV